jgi:hypothetical protein
MTIDPLRDALVELLKHAGLRGARLIVGGGYGLVLKARYVQNTGARTIRQVPLTRSTEDVDCFLSSEIISDGSQTKAIRDALDELGYTAVAEHFQFERTIDYEGQRRKIKFDFLAAPMADDRVQIKGHRTRPRAFDRLHGRLTPEAFPIESSPISIGLVDSEDIVVHIPHPFAYLILKLFALRDRLAGAESDEAKYHGWDMFTIWSMITEEELNQMPELRSQYADHPTMHDVRQIVGDLFSSPVASGSLALRAQARAQQNDVSETDLESFLSDLREILVGKNDSEETSGQGQ